MQPQDDGLGTGIIWWQQLSILTLVGPRCRYQLLWAVFIFTTKQAPWNDLLHFCNLVLHGGETAERRCQVSKSTW